MRDRFIRSLIDIQYERNDIDFHRGTFRVRGDTIEVFPPYEEDRAIRIEFFGDVVESIHEFDPLRGVTLAELDKVAIFPNSHYVSAPETPQARHRRHPRGAARAARRAQRRRTSSSRRSGSSSGRCSTSRCSSRWASAPGIENYSRWLSGRKAGDPPPCLLDYFPKDFLLVIDESHQTVPQIGAMYRGDRSRKETLVEFGFRLPSALDNRPLKFEEFERLVQPGDLRVRDARRVRAREGAGRGGRAESSGPTGLTDPEVEVRPVGSQVDDLLGEVRKRAEAARARPRHDAHEADGGGPHRVLHRRGRPLPLPALGHRHARAERAHPRPAPRRVRRARRHQPPARGARHPGGLARRGARRGQGGVPPLGGVAHPDHRPRRPQRERAGDPLRRRASPTRCAARSTRPTAAARCSAPTTRSTASRRRR